jgi:arsenate reductase
VNILFLCTGNSCRSLISEAVFNHLAPTGWQAISAGSQPTGKLNERALALPLDEHAADRSWLKAELDRIGQIAG